MERPIAVFDLTDRCPLRCRHCYFFAVENPKELDDDAFLTRVTALRDEYKLHSAFWVGGEPLLRLDLLRRAMPLFKRNAVSTSALTPIPDDLDAGLLVSIDGPRELHDDLRGAGSFDTAMRHIAALPARSFALSITLTARSFLAIEALPDLVRQTRAVGALIGIITSAANPLKPSAWARRSMVGRLLEIQARFPGVVLNPPRSLRNFLPEAASDLAAECIYHDRALAFDTALRIKPPCTFGLEADCGACGCGVVALHLARDHGCTDSDALLRALFPAPSVPAKAMAAN